MTTDVNTKITGEMLVRREQVRQEINKDNYDPKEMSFEQYRNTLHEKKELNLLKREYKAFRGTQKHIQKRDELVQLIMKAGVPKWGKVSLRLA